MTLLPLVSCVSSPSSSGQYWPHLVLVLSTVLVVITITTTLCSHTSCHVSEKVRGSGPWKIQIFFV